MPSTRTIEYYVNPLNEFSYRDLKTARDPDFLNRRDKLNQLRSTGTRYRGVRPPVLHFITQSSDFDTNGVYYTQQIVLLDFDTAMGMTDVRPIDRVKLAVEGDIAISCNDPSFKYWGFQYILTSLDANASEPENRFPRVRNPRLRGVTCKHLDLCLEVLPFLTSEITNDLRRQGYFAEWYEREGR